MGSSLEFGTFDAKVLNSRLDPIFFLLIDILKIALIPENC
jgi:hypothetical protein